MAGYFNMHFNNKALEHGARRLSPPCVIPLFLFASFFLLSACGETQIRLFADRETISAGGMDSTVITAEVDLAGEPVKTGIIVNFEATGGSFESSSELLSTSVSTDDGGNAKVRFFSGPTQGSATITATFYDDVSGVSATSSITIQFGPPSGYNTPVAGTFRLNCDEFNIGALREPIPDIRVSCYLTATTRMKDNIPATAFSPTFLTEAGSFTAEDDYYSGDRIFVYSPRGGASAPRDLEPDSSLGEPSHIDSIGLNRNPRDGLATLVAVVDGEESFTDTNGNQEYDQGEGFEDTAEPFVDANDNDDWDPDEEYLDVNGNEQWDDANGQWDASTKIMAIFKILWTGAVHNSSQTSRIERFSSTIANGGKLDIKAFVLDANMNPVAAFQKNQDYLQWTINSSDGACSSNNMLTPPMNNVLGFSFNKAETTERQRWRILPSSFTAAPFPLTLEDLYPNETDPAGSFTASVTVYVTPGPTSDGYFLNQLTEMLTDKVEGTCD